MKKYGADKKEDNQSVYEIEKDKEKAFRCAKEGCELGNMYCCANLSQMYKKGDGKLFRRMSTLKFLVIPEVYTNFVVLYETPIFYFDSLSNLKGSIVVVDRKIILEYVNGIFV